MKHQEIRDRFVKAVTQRTSLHGHWIPLAYWARLVNNSLGDNDPKIEGKTIRKALEKTNGLDRSFVPEDSSTYGRIAKIHSTFHKVFHRRESRVRTADGTKKAWFLCVEMSGKEIMRKPTGSKKDTAEYFQRQYTKFAERAH